MMWGYDWGWGMVLMALFWVVVVSGAIWLVLTVARGGSSAVDHGDAARRILGERLARGEIDAEEYKKRLTLIDETAR